MHKVVGNLQVELIFWHHQIQTSLCFSKKTISDQNGKKLRHTLIEIDYYIYLNYLNKLILKQIIFI